MEHVIRIPSKCHNFFFINLSNLQLKSPFGMWHLVLAALKSLLSPFCPGERGAPLRLLLAVRLLRVAGAGLQIEPLPGPAAQRGQGDPIRSGEIERERNFGAGGGRR